MLSFQYALQVYFVEYVDLRQISLNKHNNQRTARRKPIESYTAKGFAGN